MRLTLNKSIYNQNSKCVQNYSQIYGFSEQNFDVTNYSSVIISITFSKCTKFFNNCLIEPALFITKSRAKLKVILSENYCTRIQVVCVQTAVGVPAGVNPKPTAFNECANFF